MSEEQVALVVKFFAKLGVAAVKVIHGTITKGDLLKFKGHTTDFIAEVTSMESDNKPVEEARAGDLIGLKVQERVREKDKIYKVIP